MFNSINHPLVQSFQTSANSFNSKHNKPQRFVFRNGLRIEDNLANKAPKTARIDDLVGRNRFKESDAPVLTFTATYTQLHGEPPKSTTRFRRCKILYFTDDDEIKVYEPSQRNSGFPEGCIVSKGRYYKPDGSGYYTMDDLNVGETLVLNGRDYKLLSCDEFTRKFLTEMGYRIRSPEAEVTDPMTEDRNEANVPKSYRQPYIKDYKQKPFYENHPKRLRFYGYYGEAKNLFEEIRQVTLYYDLSNSSIKIVEARTKTKWIDGRLDTRVLLRPTKVPKPVGRKRTVEYLTDEDLDLGVIINIFGTNVILVDCDDFTKNYYRYTYNRELKTVINMEDDAAEYSDPKHVLRSLDDFPLIRNEVNLLKFYQNDKCGYEISELKFLAQIINTDDPVEKGRRFLVRWFLEDDTMDIRALDLDFEKTSIMEHKYLKRMRIMRPGSTVGKFGQCYYQSWDLFVGSVIFVRGKSYKLTDADEYTYDYMERHCDQFPYSNIKAVLDSVRKWIPDKFPDLKSRFEEKDSEKSGNITYEDFRNAITDVLSDELSKNYPDHAIKTLARYYSEEDYIGLRLKDLVAKVKTELYRKKFYDFNDLKLNFAHHDEEKIGHLKPDRIYYVLRTSSLPLDRDLLKSFIYKFPTKEGLINYNELLEALDWINNYGGYETQEPSVIQINWERTEKEKNLNKIKYICFLNDILP
ncbi:EF-hand domain-containing family member C2-like [Uloborus diversus]|uniref:EF-hand domain-containing family member C2-like n=1 Tax=Uloborus diversus TaxID=327109 RepID=UPI00240A2629|nr:EF-hand domain-containing family member C2-like [Uloborus diversus]